jgi:hypothetical protein
VVDIMRRWQCQAAKVWCISSSGWQTRKWLF